MAKTTVDTLRISVSARSGWKVGLSPVARAGSGERRSGGPDRDRTGDLMNAIHARSQLRYWPTRGRGLSYLASPVRSTVGRWPQSALSAAARVLPEGPARTAGKHASSSRMAALRTAVEQESASCPL